MKYVIQARNTTATGRGNFLKPDILAEMLRTAKAKSVVVNVDKREPNRAAKDAGDVGPFTGQYGIDIPISTEQGKRFILTVPGWSEDFQALLEQESFGPDFEKWIGKKLRLSLGQSEGGSTITRISAA